MPGQAHSLTPKHISPATQAGRAGEESDVNLVGRTVEEVERTLVLQTLSHHRGNRTYSARALGISVRTLRNKIRDYHARGVSVPEADRTASIEHWPDAVLGRPPRAGN